MEGPIDFVITWVDGQDEAWQRERAKYQSNAREDHSECSYRDWGLLPYWFRGVETFAPWVRKVHFVTWGHLPPWLNTECPKLHIVRHEDYIPKEFLPVFNSNVLEIYLHRIPGLSDRFVYFNDDVYLLQPMKPDRFFRNGKSVDMLAFQPVVANPASPVMPYLLLNNMSVLCKYFHKRENVVRQPGSYYHVGYPPLYFFYNLLELVFPLYSGLYTVHGPSPFCKETFREVWEKETEWLTSMSKNRFRDKSDLTQYLFREWQKLSGNFQPRNIKRDLSYYDLGDDQNQLLQAIRMQKSSILCVNDAESVQDEERTRQELQEAFQQILSKRSSFER